MLNTFRANERKEVETLKGKKEQVTHEQIKGNALKCKIVCGFMDV